MWKPILIPLLGIILMVAILDNPSVMKYFHAYSQASHNSISNTNTTIGSGSQFVVNIRGISSFTESNMVALISTENNVQAKKVDLGKATIEPGQENSFSPNKMIDVTITLSSMIEPNTEVTACVLQLGSGTFSQRINCNTVFSDNKISGESQKIIVPLS